MIPQAAPTAPRQPRGPNPAFASAGPRAADGDGHRAQPPADRVPAPAACPRQRQRQALPDADAAVSRLELAADVRAVRQARSHTRRLLAEWRRDELSDDAELVVSELVTNAVTASRTEAGLMHRGQRAAHVTLTIRLLAGHVAIEVLDRDPSPPVLAGAEADCDRGRGLMIVDKLSAEWGHQPVPSGGKIVYSIIGIPGCAPRPGREKRDAPFNA